LQRLDGDLALLDFFHKRATCFIRPACVVAVISLIFAFTKLVYELSPFNVLDFLERRTGLLDLFTTERYCISYLLILDLRRHPRLFFHVQFLRERHLRFGALEHPLRLLLIFRELFRGILYI